MAQGDFVMSAQDMDRFDASYDAPRPKWGFAARADESPPEFDVDEAGDYADTHDVREVVDGLNWLGVAVTALTTLIIGVAIGIWVGLFLRPAHRPAAEPIATVASRTETPRAAEPTSVAAAPPAATPEPAAPPVRAAMARLELAPPATTAEASTGETRPHSLRKAEPVAAPSPRQVAAAKPPAAAAPAKPEPEHFSPIDALLAANTEAPH
jgi:hypothetical protein